MRNDIEKNTTKGRRLNRSAFQEHLNINMIFTKELRANEELFLEIGDYSYPFNVQLPQDAAPSFEHNYARIRYTITATIDIPWFVIKKYGSVQNSHEKKLSFRKFFEYFIKCSF